MRIKVVEEEVDKIPYYGPETIVVMVLITVLLLSTNYITMLRRNR